MRTLVIALANTSLMTLIVPHDGLATPAIRTKRMLRLALQRHAALRRSEFAGEAREGTTVYDRLAAATAFSFTALSLPCGEAFPPVSTLHGTWRVAVLPDEAGALAIAARSTYESRG